VCCSYCYYGGPGYYDRGYGYYGGGPGIGFSFGKRSWWPRKGARRSGPFDRVWVLRLSDVRSCSQKEQLLARLEAGPGSNEYV
jgi:hypothetical protein